MSVQRPQEVDIPETDQLTDDSPDIAVESGDDVGVPHDDADRDVVEHQSRPPAQPPDDVDPGDYYEQSLVVDYDEDDYR